MNPDEFLSSQYLRSQRGPQPERQAGFRNGRGQAEHDSNSKNYFYTSRGIPAITYESGDVGYRSRVDDMLTVLG